MVQIVVFRANRLEFQRMECILGDFQRFIADIQKRSVVEADCGVSIFDQLMQSQGRVVWFNNCFGNGVRWENGEGLCREMRIKFEDVLKSFDLDILLLI